MKKQLASALVAAVMTLSGTAIAEGVYLGGSFGQTSVDLMTGTVGAITITADDTDTGLKAFVGFDILDQLAIEVGYADLGDSVQTATVIGGVNTITYSGSAFFVDAVGRLKISESARLFAKLGIARTSVDVNDVDNGVFCFCTLNSTMKSTNLKYGVGAEYLFDKALAVRGEYEVISDAGDDATYGESDISMFSVGLTYKF